MKYIAWIDKKLVISQPLFGAFPSSWMVTMIAWLLLNWDKNSSLLFSIAVISAWSSIASKLTSVSSTETSLRIRSSSSCSTSNLLSLSCFLAFDFQALAHVACPTSHLGPIYLQRGWGLGGSDFCSLPIYFLFHPTSCSCSLYY